MKIVPLIMMFIYCANCIAQDDLWLIEPSLNKAGIISFSTTGKDLINKFGANNVAPHDIHIGEGDTIQGTVIFPKNPIKRAYISWRDPENKANPLIIIIKDSPTLWKTTYNITVGTTLKEVEKINSADFNIIGYDVHGTGKVLTWNDGKLINSRLTVYFSLPKVNEFTKEETKFITREYPYLIHSQLKTMQDKNLPIEELQFKFKHE